ncbi:MAG: hypothetical protein A3G41_03205 [Elusimicrobia bacterium RIFCSPLOWO2_12_FULL_59_9]|nr:MAG: hypothetical protein A3G41_03205 [Elusimicrobia bacterium RIFCSPLOWO2_12_FULL_59_9]
MPKKKILVIEDEPDYQRLFKTILAAEGYGVVLADNGEEGLKLLEETSPDLIFLDINMPKMDGYEVCTKIRSGEVQPRIPIIFITIRSQVEEIVQGLKLGADDYILKPFSPEEVLARVAALLRKTSAS